MRVALLLVPVALLGACGKDEPQDTAATSPTGLDLRHVMRDCEPGPGIICPWAGDGYNGFNGDGKEVLDAWLSFPLSVSFSPYGPPVVADWNNHKLRMIEGGKLVTIMGTEFLGDGDPLKADLTDAGALGTDVALNHPTQHSYFSDGTLVSASWHTHKIRTWTPSTNRVHVILGGAPGWNNLEVEPADTTLFNQPKELAVDSLDNLYVLDMRNERVRYVDFAANTTTTIAGNGTKDYCGDGDLATAACFNFPKNANPEPGGALALDEAGGKLYIADTESHVVRVLDLNTGVIDLLAGTPKVAGDVDGTGGSAQFNWPADLALWEGVLYVADSNNHKIRAIDVATGAVSTFAGTGEPTCPISGTIAIPQVCDGQQEAGDGGPASAATLYRPFGVDVDLDGNVVISDSYNHRIRIVTR